MVAVDDVHSMNDLSAEVTARRRFHMFLPTMISTIAMISPPAADPV
jgi:hypothetical protein